MLEQILGGRKLPQNAKMIGVLTDLDVAAADMSALRKKRKMSGGSDERAQDLGWQEVYKRFIKERVRNQFPTVSGETEWFTGEIETIKEVKDGSYLFGVRYEDNDFEEYTNDEISELMQYEFDANNPKDSRAEQNKGNGTPISEAVGMGVEAAGVAAATVATAAGAKAGAKAAPIPVWDGSKLSCSKCQWEPGKLHCSYCREAPAISDAPLSVGRVVNVDARTEPGSNKLGGVARIMSVNVTQCPESRNGTLISYNIKYVLGGTEKGVSPQFIHAYDEGKMGEGADSKVGNQTTGDESSSMSTSDSGSTSEEAVQVDSQESLEKADSECEIVSLVSSPVAMVDGCPKCRWCPKGCKRCRSPSFKAKRLMTESAVQIPTHHSPLSDGD
jgi:hypothetical protein